MNRGATKETLNEISKRYRDRWVERYDDNIVVEFLRADCRAIDCKWVQRVVWKWFKFGNYEMLSKYIGGRRVNHERQFVRDLFVWKDHISWWINRAGGNKSAGYCDMAEALGEDPEGGAPDAIKKLHRDIYRRIMKRLSRK